MEHETSSNSADADDITGLISGLASGTPGAHDRLFSVIYDELHGLAARVHRQSPNQSICPTELVNEAYLRLVRQRFGNLRDRGHFFCIAARILRRVLVDRARARNALKRGGDAERDRLSTLVDARSIHSRLHQLDVLALEEALEQLAEQSPSRAQVVELRFFAGLSVEETAEAMGVHEITVKRHWKFAQAWLAAKMSDAKGTS